MNPDTHSLAGAYAVDAVTDEERRSFEAHLEACPDCRAEVAELRGAAAALAADVELTPPPALRGSILSTVSQTRRVSPLVDRDDVSESHRDTTAGDASTGGDHAAHTDRASSSAGIGSPAADPGSPTVGSPDELAGRRARRNRVVPWLAGVAAAAVLAVGVATWQPWADDARRPLTATEQVLRAEDAQRLEQPMNGSTVAIVRSPSQKQAVLVADGMPTPPAGKAYQLWFDMPGRGMVSAGMVPAGSTVTVLLEGDASTATGAGITLEPASGSEQPTSAPVALFAFT